MQVETKFIAKDGKKFDTQPEAEAYEAELDRKADERYTKYLTSSAGKRLLQDHSSTEEGYWHAIGESDDPGIGGGRGPDLGIYKGRLVDVIRKVTAMNAFWSWGGGGYITKVNVTEL
ncbi:MAG: hypothetical protein M0R77_12925 [Gammaproteobacteria bacterium]|jgi:hypothetical protein|nr:hypothetical protein [Gammaproteobacteria bacterium]